jgi:hypothetical protein
LTQAVTPHYVIARVDGTVAVVVAGEKCRGTREPEPEMVFPNHVVLAIDYAVPVGVGGQTASGSADGVAPHSVIGGVDHHVAIEIAAKQCHRAIGPAGGNVERVELRLITIPRHTDRIVAIA